ncbi:hypothetical protein [Arenibaculum sp.]|jgi:GH24 family phage-related lysozyme (muramidase)|uniref:hypothetical protein n=1 Tax=Arenibaculum sp. TaxID=2865862 RepID=UPI002E0D7A23|nr:hypothetical protein [Arenibaculum sp.]
MISFRAATTDAYQSTRFSLISTAEGVQMAPYLDIRGIATIGIGFNISTFGTPVGRAVLAAMGIDPEAAQEKPWIDRLGAAVAAAKTNAALQSGLDAVMAERATAGVPGLRTRFAFASALEARGPFDACSATYESQIDGWLAGVPPSPERAVLFSLAYNGLLAHSPSLHAAVQAGDRAEAWFQIRYDSNGGASRSLGIAQRRCYESELFAIQDDPAGNPTAAEAAAMARMNAARMDAMAQVEAAFPTAVEKANQNFDLTQLATRKVRTREETLAPALAVA